MPANSIECRGLAKHYGDTVVVHSFDFTVAANEFVILLGPSGCGKSTILRMLAGLEDISKGELLIDGELSNDRSPGDRGIAMVFQNYALYPHMTVANNVAFGLRRTKVPEPEITRRVAEVAAILGLEPYLGRRPAELSGGQQQRVAIARAMIKTPRVFLFDEPLSNLDAKLRTHMRIEIARLHRSLKATTIYVTHDQHEAMTLADRIVLLKDGRIEQVGTPEEIFERPLSRFVAGFIGTPPMNFLEMALRRESTGFLLTCTHGSLRISGKHHALGGRDRVTVGIRPVHLKPARADATQDALFGEVELVEYLGHEVQVNLDCGCGQLAAIVPAWQRPAVGERLGFTAEEADIHLFDCNTGASLALGGPNAVRSSRVRELRPLATAQSWSTG